MDVCDASVNETVRGDNPDVGEYEKSAIGGLFVTFTHDEADDIPNGFMMVSLIDQFPEPNVIDGDAELLQTIAVPFPPVEDEFV